MNRLFKNIKYSPEIFLRTVLCSWFFTSFINLLVYKTPFTSLAFGQDKGWKLIVTAVIMAAAFVALTVIEYKLPDRKITEYSLVASYLLFALMVLT